MANRILTQGDIEQSILALCDELEEETYRYAELADLAAEAEADYKEKASRTFVAIANMDVKMTAGEKSARVDEMTCQELRIFKINEARRHASKEALLSLRARLDALRTLSANVRHQT